MEATGKGTVVMIGDVGGTNVRLQLIRLSGQTLGDKEIILDSNEREKPYMSQEKEGSLISYIDDFLKDIQDDVRRPKVCVIGMPGTIKDNKTTLTNVSHWGEIDGNAIAKDLGIKSLLFINDFEAAAYGVTQLRESDYDALGESGKIPLEEGANSVKVVIGPGTGLGQAILIRKEEAGMYEPIPSEGGHVDFSAITEEDWELAQFARSYIENSNNVENLRNKPEDRKNIGRLSVERLCAGPAVPLIYSYMKKKYPYYKEMDRNFDDLTAKDIMKKGTENNDPLCLKVVQKFVEILGTETGNLALKTLPYGGIYITGGVTESIQQYLLTKNTFMDAFINKGRQSKIMKERFRVMVVKPSINLGLLGAEEKARRDLLASGKNTSAKKRKAS